MEKKKLNIEQKWVVSMIEGRLFQLIRKAWDALTKCFSLGLLLVVTEPYMLLNPAMIQFQLTSKWSDEYISLKQ